MANITEDLFRIFLQVTLMCLACSMTSIPFLCGNIVPVNVGFRQSFPPREYIRDQRVGHIMSTDNILRFKQATRSVLNRPSFPPDVNYAAPLV